MKTLMCPDIFSTSLSRAESGDIKVGDAVATRFYACLGDQRIATRV
jgi:hypothetical protein